MVCDWPHEMRSDQGCSSGFHRAADSLRAGTPNRERNSERTKGSAFLKKTIPKCVIQI